MLIQNVSEAFAVPCKRNFSGLSEAWSRGVWPQQCGNASRSVSWVQRALTCCIIPRTRRDVSHSFPCLLRAMCRLNAHW